jgi:hypothetical protein
MALLLVSSFCINRITIGSGFDIREAIKEDRICFAYVVRWS